MNFAQDILSDVLVHNIKPMTEIMFELDRTQKQKNTSIKDVMNTNSQKFLKHKTYTKNCKLKFLKSYCEKISKGKTIM